ncbi:MAG: elongation factor G [Magnetococcales bacterium]|nr:elongation factor G [Magnetococcales bacterium]
MNGSYDIRAQRSVALVSHGGGGKTMLAESMLFNGKAIDKRGVVEKGTTTLSTEPEEAQRGLTITPHLAQFHWREVDIHLIDTPGFIDYLEMTRGALQVVGGAVMLFSGVSGVKPETERLWEMVREALVAPLGFINEMDKPRADFIRVLGEIEQSLGVTALPLTMPIGAGESFQGIVDLIPMTAWSAKDGVFVQIPLPESAREDALYYRSQLVERIVEGDDALLTNYLDNGVTPDEATLHQGLREAVLTRRLLPVFCGSAQANIGVRALLNGIAYYLPSPPDKAVIKPLTGRNPESGVEVSRQAAVEEPFSAVVFKTVVDPFSGKLSLIRLFSGELLPEREFLNSTRGVKERSPHLYRVVGKKLEEVGVLRAGEMGALAKLPETRSGDTLCAPQAPIVYDRVRYQEPTLTYAVEVEAKTEEKVSNGLARLVEEDPTLQMHRDGETHEILLSGMGQTQLMVVLERLKRKYGAVATLKTPRVPYRETLRRKVRVQGRIKKQSGGRGQFADCWVEMEPLGRGEGFVFEDRIVGGAIPRQFIPSVEKGIRESLAHGVVGGYPVVDVRVALVDGGYHSVDSSDYAFKSAGAAAFKQGMEQGEAVLLEPIMAMEVVVPDDVLGDCIGDLNSRRGRITGVVPKGHHQTIKAEAPMAEVLDYGNVLNGLTSGRGLYTMQVATYQEVPSHIARKVLEK